MNTSSPRGAGRVLLTKRPIHRKKRLKILENRLSTVSKPKQRAPHENWGPNCGVSWGWIKRTTTGKGGGGRKIEKKKIPDTPSKP